MDAEGEGAAGGQERGGGGRRGQTEGVQGTCGGRSETDKEAGAERRMSAGEGCRGGAAGPGWGAKTLCFCGNRWKPFGNRPGNRVCFCGNRWKPLN